MHLLLAGINHRTASLAAREALAFDARSASQLAADAVRSGDIREAVVLSTCNRTEFYAIGSSADAALAALRSSVRHTKGSDLLDSPSVYRFEGVAAVRHAFQVASGLDSMVLGEGQILSQLKET